MGWDSFAGWKSSADVRDSILHDYKEMGSKVLAVHSFRSEFWIVSEYQRPAKDSNRIADHRVMEVHLIEKKATGNAKSSLRPTSAWYKKSLAITEFPYYFECPEKLIEAFGGRDDIRKCGENATKWLAVRDAYWERRTYAWTVGEECTIDGTEKGAPVYRVERTIDARNCMIRKVETGKLFKCRRERMFRKE